MADPWIRVHARLRGRPVVARLANTLRIDAHKAMGHLVEFWGAVAAHAENGDVAALPDSLLEHWAGWSGKRGAFAKWLRDCHLDESGRVKEWDDYQGTLEQRRTKDAERKRLWREKMSANVPADSDDASDGRHADVTRTVTGTGRGRPGVTVRYGTERNGELLEQQQTTLPKRAKKRRVGLMSDNGELANPQPDLMPPDNWPAQFGDWWNANVGAVEYGLVGKKLKPAHKQFGLTRLLAGAAVYNDPQEGPPRKNFPDFAGNCAFWVSLAEMPMFDADGNDTLRLKRLPPITPRWNGAR